MKNYEPCEEMIKFRNALDELNIIWHDESDELVCRTHINYGGYTKLSFVNGIGTYGGDRFMSGKNDGLIEFYNFTDEPTGYLYAEQCIDIVKSIVKVCGGN